MILHQKLRVLYRRYQAGIPLSDSEMKLLFPKGESSASVSVLQSDSDDESALKLQTSFTAAKRENQHTQETLPATSSTTMVFGGSSSTVENNTGSNTWNAGAFLRQFETLKSTPIVKSGNQFSLYIYIITSLTLILLGFK